MRVNQSLCANLRLVERVRVPPVCLNKLVLFWRGQEQRYLDEGQPLAARLAERRGLYYFPGEGWCRLPF